MTGTFAAANSIALQLPVTGWTQRYVQTGCGGECGGPIFTAADGTIPVGNATGCTPVENDQVAVATTDMGHVGDRTGAWADKNPQAQIDFAYRSQHKTALIAKALIARFYGHRAAYSYFDGCSDGGREALMEAQRFPHDFDGIAAGAPAQDMDVQNIFHHAWNVLANLDTDGKFILLADKLPLIHDAVLAACDNLDGVEDGVLQDPRLCHFNPATLRCRAGQDTSTCLTAAQVRVVRRLHMGAVTESGKRLEPAISHEWGSELDWSLFVPAAQGDTSGSEGFVLAYARYLGYGNLVRPNWTLANLKLTVHSFWRGMQSSSYLSAMDPQLQRFKASGGKLVLWHGWGDQHISPQGTLAYWHAMKQTMGVRSVNSFAKLYMFPGVGHCAGNQPGHASDGPNVFDVLTPVMAWTESGRRPGKIVASRVDDAGAVTETRPVYPYPTTVKYDGTGSTDVASNFTPVRHQGREPGPGYTWLGQRLFSHGYQTWCRAVGTKLVCRPTDTWLTRKVARSS